MSGGKLNIAAVVLPFFRLCRRGVLPTALVVGACAPDLSYVYAMRKLGDYAHEFPGFILFCVPVGLAVLVWLEALVLPALDRARARGFELDPLVVKRAQRYLERCALPMLFGVRERGELTRPGRERGRRRTSCRSRRSAKTFGRCRWSVAPPGIFVWIPPR